MYIFIQTPNSCLLIDMTDGTQELMATITAIPMQAWLLFMFDLDYVKFAEVYLTSTIVFYDVAHKPFRRF